MVYKLIEKHADVMIENPVYWKHPRFFRKQSIFSFRIIKRQLKIYHSKQKQSLNLMVPFIFQNSKILSIIILN